MAAQLMGMKGKVSFLRVNDRPADVWGAPPDQISYDVIVKISSKPDIAVGFDVSAGDPHLAARISMLASLRQAYLHDKDVVVAYLIEPGRKTGQVVRVEYGTG